MPNGDLGGGTGTQESPFEIWDAYDLNALRGKPTSSADRIYINFKADIDFAGTPYEGNFATIRFGNNTANASSYDYVDIDGEGHAIRNWKLSGSDDNACGLFARINGSIVNIKIVNCDLVFTSGSNPTGVLSNYLTTLLIEKIKISGTVTNQYHFGGIAYSISAADVSQTCVVQNCVVNLKNINKSSSSFNGYIFSCGSTTKILFYKCVSACNVYAENGGANLSGFVGNTSGTNTFDSCICHCKFVMISAALQFTSVVAGYRATTNSVTMTLRNCISKCRFEGKPPSTANNMSAFAPAYANASQCYSVCEYDLKDSAANIRGGDGVALFDWEVSGLPLSRFTDSANGVTTAQLQDRSFLESKGWTF